MGADMVRVIHFKVQWQYVSISAKDGESKVLNLLHAKIAWWMNISSREALKNLPHLEKHLWGNWHFQIIYMRPVSWQGFINTTKSSSPNKHMSQTRYLQRLEARTDSNHHLNGQFRRPKDPFPLPLAKTSQPMMPLFCWICFNQMCECGIVWSSSYSSLPHII